MRRREAVVGDGGADGPEEQEKAALLETLMVN